MCFVLRNFVKFTEKHLFFNKVEASFIKNETLIQVFSCKFCIISKNTLFTEHFWETGFVFIFSKKWRISSFLFQCFKCKRLGMFDIYWRVSKFNQDKRWFLYKKNYFGNYHEARATSKKLKKSQKQKMLLFSPRAFLMLSNGWFPLLSQIKRYDCLFCWYWSIIIDNNSDSACALNRLCLNAMGILHPKIKLTMNLYA